MSAALGNLVHETTTGTGTGNLTIASVNGKQRVSQLLTRLGLSFGDNGVSNPVIFISNRNAAEWEVVRCYLSDANTLVRASIIESSNNNAAVSFSAGSKDVTNDVDAETQASAIDYGLVTGAVTLSDDDGSVA